MAAGEANEGKPTPAPSSTLSSPLSNHSSAPSTSHTVIGVELRLDVADASQQFTQNRLLVATETGLNTTHPLSRVTVDFHCAVTVGTKGLDTTREETNRRQLAQS